MRTTRRILPFAVLLLVAACEGEPPKTPAAALQPSGGPTNAEPTAESEDSTQKPPAASPIAANACGCCPCALGDGGAGEGGVEMTATVPASVSPPAPQTATITGTVTMASKPLPFAVVYLEDAPIEPNAKMTARIDNQQMSFAPFITVLPAGGKVTFANSDPFPHNVFSPDAEKFNMGTIAQHQAVAHVFPKSGAYTLLCNLHPGMLGYIVVTPSSYFGKTDAKGHYAIKAVPPGTHQVTAWSPRLPLATQSVTAKGGDATLDFELHR